MCALTNRQIVIFKSMFVGLLKTKLQGAPIGSIGIFIFRQQEKTV